jgi:23S rRNA A2030 N6-methylase RlmJ
MLFELFTCHLPANARRVVIILSVPFEVIQESMKLLGASVSELSCDSAGCHNMHYPLGDVAVYGWHY